MSRRGYAPKDEKEFGQEALKILNGAAKEVQFLLDRGYELKSAATFVGNHHLLSTRQRLALLRSVSKQESVMRRNAKEVLHCKAGILPETARIDGFNTVITLETALCGSPVLCCNDGAIRDLAGLRGTYRIIDQTQKAICLILERLEVLKIKNACFYLDEPVSNSGRLSSLILTCGQESKIHVTTELINDVDRVLKTAEGVVTSDSVILDNCISWLNLLPAIIQKLPCAWVIRLQ